MVNTLNPHLQLIALQRATRLKPITIRQAEILLLELEINVMKRKMR